MEIPSRLDASCTVKWLCRANNSEYHLYAAQSRIRMNYPHHHYHHHHHHHNHHHHHHHHHHQHQHHHHRHRHRHRHHHHHNHHHLGVVRTVFQVTLVSNRINLIHVLRKGWKSLSSLNYDPTVMKFCSLRQGAKLLNCRGKIVDRRISSDWPLIRGLSWSSLIKVVPVVSTVFFF